MTSTSFTVGFGESKKASSKVLRPPGGGSSDIFGTSDGSISPTQTSPRKNLDDSQNRLFGSPNSSQNGTPRRASIDRMKSNIFSKSDAVDASTPNTASKKSSVSSRNPITGFTKKEVSTVNGHHHHQNGLTNGNVQNGGDSGGETGVSTTIKVQNPPGGQSQVQFY